MGGLGLELMGPGLQRPYISRCILMQHSVGGDGGGWEALAIGVGGVIWRGGRL
jgi:hypothetical protein